MLFMPATMAVAPPQQLVSMVVRRTCQRQRRQGPVSMVAAAGVPASTITQSSWCVTTSAGHQLSASANEDGPGHRAVSTGWRLRGRDSPGRNREAFLGRRSTSVACFARACSLGDARAGRGGGRHGAYSSWEDRNRVGCGSASSHGQMRHAGCNRVDCGRKGPRGEGRGGASRRAQPTCRAPRGLPLRGLPSADRGCVG